MNSESIWIILNLARKEVSTLFTGVSGADPNQLTFQIFFNFIIFIKFRIPLKNQTPFSLHLVFSLIADLIC